MKWICVYKVPIYLPWLVICYKVKTWIALILQRCCYGYANATFHHLWADTESHILVCEQKCQVSPPFPNPLISIFNFSTIPLFHWFHIAGDGQLSVENTYTEHVCGWVRFYLHCHHMESTTWNHGDYGEQWCLGGNG